MKIFESFTRSDGTGVIITWNGLLVGDFGNGVIITKCLGNPFLMGGELVRYYECKPYRRVPDLNPKTIQQIAVNFRGEIGAVYNIGGVRFTMFKPYVLAKENG